MSSTKLFPHLLLHIFLLLSLSTRSQPFYLLIHLRLNSWLLNLTPLPVSLAQFQLTYSKTSCLLSTITHMINRSLDTGYVPLGLKIAAITPVLRNPSLFANLSNFKPVCNLLFIVKVFEKLSHSCSLSWINLLEQYQSGFWVSHSTETALVRVNDFLLVSDTGVVSLLVLPDLSAAFDIQYSFLICLLLVSLLMSFS